MDKIDGKSRRCIFDKSMANSELSAGHETVNKYKDGNNPVTKITLEDEA